MNTVVENDLGRHEILTGWDEGTTYKLGDQVKWWPLMDRPGVGIDGVYVGLNWWEDTEARFTALVAISNGNIVEVATAENRFDCLYLEDPVYALHRKLELKWTKHQPNRDLWPAEIWADREKRAAEIKQGVFRRSAQLPEG